MQFMEMKTQSPHTSTVRLMPYWLVTIAKKCQICMPDQARNIYNSKQTDFNNQFQDFNKQSNLDAIYSSPMQYINLALKQYCGLCCQLVQ